jgi:hypothetical protein
MFEEGYHLSPNRNYPRALAPANRIFLTGAL